MKYWLFKSEPSAYSIDDLVKADKQTSPWDGVRNYQARNFMRDDMQPGDQGFFYHSSCNEPGIVGIVKIVKSGYPDFTAYDPKSKYFDPKSTVEKPLWYMVDVKLLRKLKRSISLKELKQNASLADMQLLRKGNRLSVMPVSYQHWQSILGME